MTGRICLDILADKWAAAMDVRGLLLRYVDITPFSPQVIEILANKLFYYRSIFFNEPSWISADRTRQDRTETRKILTSLVDYVTQFFVNYR
jgi:hypothetical protein